MGTSQQLQAESYIGDTSEFSSIQAIEDLCKKHYMFEEFTVSDGIKHNLKLNLNSKIWMLKFDTKVSIVTTNEKQNIKENKLL